MAKAPPRPHMNRPEATTQADAAPCTREPTSPPPFNASPVGTPDVPDDARITVLGGFAVDIKLLPFGAHRRGNLPDDSVGLLHHYCFVMNRRRDDREAAGMSLFKRKTRATRRAEARAIKAKAKLEAKLAAKNEARRIKAEHKAETNALKAQLRAQRDSDKAALKVAQTQLKAAREGKLFSATRIRRVLTVTRLLAPVVVPLFYRAAIAARGFLDERRADRLGVPLSQLGLFSGHGAALSARIAGAEHSLRLVAEKKPKDAETKQFVAAITERLRDLSAAVTAAENMPTSRRRAAHAAIAEQLDGIDADLLARLGLV